jgi:hypothetical protein
MSRFYWRKIRRYDGEICDDCKNPVAKNMGSWWEASDEHWAKVVGRNDVILCPLCFFKRSSYFDVPMHWVAKEGV